MSDFQYHLNAILGPALGFLFTAGTLLFIALNAHRTGRVKASTEATPPQALS
jgi:hypothetical protein